MKAGEALKSIMKKQNVTQSVMARRLNAKSRQVVGMRLNMDNLSVHTVNEMCKALGYKIVLMPDTTPTPKDAYEVE